MSLIQHAFIERSKVPSPRQWQTAIDRTGYNLKLDSKLKPFSDSGFLPCILDDKESGFEIYYENTEEYLSDYPTLKEKLENRDAVITFRWGGDFRECACVCITSLALLESFDALIYYPDDDMIYDSETTRDDIAACYAEIEKETS